MHQLRTARQSSLVLAALSTVLGCGEAFAANPITYPAGTFVVTSADGQSDFTQLILTFDGAGNVSGTKTDNSNGTITTGTFTGTYTVTADGVATVTNSSNGQVQTAQLSADGNSFTGLDIQSGQSPDGFFAVRQGPVALLNNPSGLNALASNTTGYDNNAVGDFALVSNTTGYLNNAVGYNAMAANTTGYNNNAQGGNALSSNVSGFGNSAMGANALINLTGGNRNVGVGNNTGTSLLTGSYNVDIGWGVTGSGDESGVVRIGNPTYATSAYVAGVAGATITGNAVYVTASGQLGVLASSERFKTDITTLGTDADRLQRLRPVSFHLKSDPHGALQYGLIAEEVDQIYPELVIRDEKGQIQGLRYDELAPILLTVVQQQQQKLALEAHAMDARTQELSEARAQIAAMATKDVARDSELADLKQQLAEIQQFKTDMQAALANLRDGDSRLARR